MLDQAWVPTQVSIRRLVSRSNWMSGSVSGRPRHPIFPIFQFGLFTRPRNPRFKDAHTGTKSRLEQPSATRPLFGTNLHFGQFVKISTTNSGWNFGVNVRNVRMEWTMLSSFDEISLLFETTQQSLGPRNVVWNIGELSWTITRFHQMMITLSKSVGDSFQKGGELPTAVINLGFLDMLGFWDMLVFLGCYDLL
jgi:hypothetical protein